MTTRTGPQPQPSKDLSWRELWVSARRKWRTRVITLAEKDLEAQEQSLRLRHGIVVLSSAEDQLSEIHRWSIDDAIPGTNEHCIECDTKRISLGTGTPALSGVLACPKCDLIEERRAA